MKNSISVASVAYETPAHPSLVDFNKSATAAPSPSPVVLSSYLGVLIARGFPRKRKTGWEGGREQGRRTDLRQRVRPKAGSHASEDVVKLLEIGMQTNLLS